MGVNKHDARWELLKPEGGPWNLADFVLADGWDDELLTRYRLWCLGHNLDVAAALTATAELSWRKGFDAGTILADLTHEFQARAAQ